MLFYHLIRHSFLHIDDTPIRIHYNNGDMTQKKYFKTYGED